MPHSETLPCVSRLSGEGAAGDKRAQRWNKRLAAGVRLLATTWLVALAACSGIAQAPEASTIAEAQAPGTSSHIALSRNDVTFNQEYFQLGSQYWTATCGYSILGNHLSQKVPRSEWAVSVDEMMQADAPVVRVRAAAFEVLSKERNSLVKMRPPITALTFTLQDGGEPLATRIIGQPNRINAITAMLDTAAAKRLFEAFYGAEPIEISLTYADGTLEVLEVRNWSDVESASGFNYLRRCLEFLHPAPAGAPRFIYRVVAGPHGEPVICSTKHRRFEDFCFNPFSFDHNE